MTIYNRNLEIFASIQLAEDDTREGPGRITGTLLSYGEVASDRPMVFADGALTWPDGGIVLNLQHDRTKHLARFAPTAQGARLLVDVRLPDHRSGQGRRDAHSRRRTHRLISRGCAG